MTEQTTPEFVAIIGLSLPGSGEKFSANVTLLPQDQVKTDGRYKLLTECTLADLQAYADQLEEEIWETYQEITLVELAKDEALDLELTITTGEGQPVAPDGKFLNSMVVTISAQNDAAIHEPAAVSSDRAVEEPQTEEVAVSDEAPATEAEASESETTIPETTLPEPEPELTETEAEDEPQIVVAESEPIYEEPEAESEIAETPTIAPSRARVRIAGKRKPIGDPTWAAVDIFIEEPALRAAQAHALTSMNREVAGVLIGPPPEKQPDGRYIVHIHDTIIAKYTVMQGASVTYTPESWRYMNDVLQERYPDETAVMVGWYHTHPGFGIFLSGMDLFIHQNFFTQIWHVAFVIDPRARSSGFFCWNRHKSEVRPLEFPWPAWASGSW